MARELSNKMFRNFTACDFAGFFCFTFTSVKPKIVLPV